MRVFLGVTGASGAPYAERLLRALAAVDCEIGLTASRSGIEVLATELYKDPSLAREEVLERFVGGAAAQVTVYGENDFRSPYASGSARVDAYVDLPVLDGDRRDARSRARCRTSSTGLRPSR